MKRSAIITGLGGQDGSFAAEKFLGREYKVFGLIRRSSRGSDLGCASFLEGNPDLEVVEGDITDPHSMDSLFRLASADVCLHTASQSHVGSSFKQPYYTGLCTGLGTLNCLEAIRKSGIHTRFLACSTSELFGGISSKENSEESPFHPRSPYGVAKLYSHWITINYRESFKMFACNAISHNHESERRPDTFVTRKITKSAARISCGLQEKLYLGNLDARRDWSYAGDVVDGMIAILESARPEEYVFGTGEAHSVREFCDHAFAELNMDYRDYVEVDPRFFRPADVDVLVADYSKAKKELGWEPKTTFKELVTKMVKHDLELAKKEAKDKG